jgi:hypothetical protein
VIGSRPVRLAVVLLASALVLPAVPAVASREVKLEILSGRADKVTGGDALVHVDAPDARVRVTVNGVDVTSAFTADDGGLTGLVGNLRLGSNVLRAEADGRRTTLEVRNYPRQGPVFSGPHEQPFVCETASFAIPVIGGRSARRWMPLHGGAAGRLLPPDEGGDVREVTDRRDVVPGGSCEDGCR